MKTNSKQIQTLWEEHTGKQLRNDLADLVVKYVGTDSNRFSVVESFIKRAGKLSFATEIERFGWFTHSLHDLHVSGPLPAQILKEPAARSFANAHDRKLRAASHIIEEFLERPWHRGMKNATVSFIEKVNAMPEDFWAHAVKFWETAFPVTEDVEIFIRDRGLRSLHGELAMYAAKSLDHAAKPSDSASV